MDTRTETSSETDHLRRLERLLEASQLLHSTLELTELTPIVLGLVRDIVPVDRCTLFVADHKQRLLRSFVAEGVAEFQITLPFGQGLAGTAAVTGEPLEVLDAYEDKRFAAEFDDRLVYRTRDVFCVPVFNREGVVIGVLQLLNRLRPLTGEDKEFLSKICIYLGLALHNAWIHRQLVESKKIEEELKLVRDRLANAEKLSVIGELVAGIVHEVRNPLAAALGHCALLRDGIDPSTPEGDRVGKVEGLIKRALKIASEFLSFAAAAKRDRVATDLNAIIRQTADLLDYESRSRLVRVMLELKELPLLEADPGKIQQVLVNLLKNAHETEGVRTTRVLSSYEPQKQIVRIEVRDDGPGIPASVQARLFEPFFTTKPRGSGTGLGLAISKRIIEEHGGSLSCKSSLGNGSTFLIELPA